MSVPVTIHLPDELYERAKRFAHLANRDIGSVITDTMLASLPVVGKHIAVMPSIETLTDTELLALANSRMPAEQDARMSQLLTRQRENELTEDEPQELAAMMQFYQEGWLRQTTAMAEAVKRGLMEPMDA